jgi:hypothetical protein
MEGSGSSLDELMKICDVTGDAGTVPGLGDFNCYKVNSVNPSVGATVVVRKGNLDLEVSVAMIGVTQEGIVAVATLAAGRLP